MMVPWHAPTGSFRHLRLYPFQDNSDIVTLDHVPPSPASLQGICGSCGCQPNASARSHGPCSYLCQDHTLAPFLPTSAGPLLLRMFLNSVPLLLSSDSPVGCVSHLPSSGKLVRTYVVRTACSASATACARSLSYAGNAHCVYVQRCTMLSCVADSCIADVANPPSCGLVITKNPALLRRPSVTWRTGVMRPRTQSVQNA